MNSLQITIEENITEVQVTATPIVVYTGLAVTQVGAGNYLFADLDTYKTAGFLRFLNSTELQFDESSVSKMYGTTDGVWLDLGGVDLKIRNNSAERFTFGRTTGDFTAVGNISAYSDNRIKTDILKIGNALEKIMQLNGVTFTNIITNRKSTGLIAQEVQKVLPEVIGYDDEGFLTVAYGNMIGLLVEAIKELAGAIKNDNSCGCNCNKTGGSDTQVFEP